MGDSYYSFAEILDRPYTHILQFQRAIRESPLRHIALLRSIPSFKASAKKNMDGEVAIPILFVMPLQNRSAEQFFSKSIRVLRQGDRLIPWR